MNRKFIYKLHKWAGVTLGFFLFLMALSGVGITFSHELLPRFYPDLFHIEVQEKSLAPHELYSRLHSRLSGGRKVTNIYSSEDADEAYLVLYRDPSKTFPVMMTINQYTGETVGEMSMIKNFFAIMLFMHANLFLGKVGSYFVGLLGLVLLFFVASGIYIWIPKKNLLDKVVHLFNRGTKRITQKLHHTLGLVFAIPLLISAFTGFFTIYDLPYYIMRPLKDEPVRIDEMERKGECHFEEEMSVLKTITPVMEKNLISIHFCSHKSNLMKVSYGLYDRDFLKGYGRIVVDPKETKILQTFNSETDPTTWNLKRLTIYPIHTGEYFGMTGRVINLLTGLALMLIFCTGLFLFISRRKH